MTIGGGGGLRTLKSVGRFFAHMPRSRADTRRVSSGESRMQKTDSARYSATSRVIPKKPWRKKSTGFSRKSSKAEQTPIDVSAHGLRWYNLWMKSY